MTPTGWPGGRPELLDPLQAEVSSAAARLSSVAGTLARSSVVVTDWAGIAAEAAWTDRMDLVGRGEAVADVLRLVEHAIGAAREELAVAAYLAEQNAEPSHVEVGAARVDAELAFALRGALSQLPTAPPGSGTAPSWWRGLSPEQQRDEVERHPELVGPTDGLPGWARDRANRILLDRAEPVLVGQVAALAPPPLSVTDLMRGQGSSLTVGTLGGGARRVAYQQAVDKLAAVRATRQVLDQRDGQTRQLLVFDVSGRQAEVAVAVGDVDRAGHVAVVVDGFTTTVHDDLAGADRVAVDLVELARREAMGWGDRGEAAVVTWLGYDAPQAADTLRSTHSVVLPASAQAGATSLAGFLRGVDTGTHVTLVGHSYGSTVAGLAVAQGGTGVDDLVVMGSPGLGVSDIGRLGLAADRIHVVEADDDPVADLGWFGRDPDRLPGIDRLSSSTTALPDGATGTRSVGHSQYLAPGTTSQWNVAAVVAGVPQVAAR